MIEVFKTNIRRKKEAENIISLLAQQLPGANINVDLQDRDRILRIEHRLIPAPEIIFHLNSKGYECAVLEG